MHCDSEMSKEKFQKKLPSEIVIVLKYPWFEDNEQFDKKPGL